TSQGTATTGTSHVRQGDEEAAQGVSLCQPSPASLSSINLLVSKHNCLFQTPRRRVSEPWSEDPAAWRDLMRSSDAPRLYGEAASLWSIWSASSSDAGRG